MNEIASSKAPLGYWIVAILGLLWNSFGAYDYLMTRFRNIDYLSQMGDPQMLLAWIDGFPLWAQIGWGLGVWASVTGSLLMLARSRHAVTAFLVSLIGAVVSFSYQFIGPVPAELDTAVNKVIPFVIMGIILLLWWYSRRAAARGILR